MTSEELQYAVKSLIAGGIAIATPDITEAQVWDTVDALFAERTRRDAKSAPVGASSTAVDETQGDAVPRFTAEEVAERLVRVEPDAVGVSALVYVGGIAVRVEESRDEAERVAGSFRVAFIRTLEAKP